MRAPLASSYEDKPPCDFAPCGRSPLLASSGENKPAGFLRRGQAFFFFLRDSTPYGRGPLRLLPWARTSLLASSGEDKSFFSFCATLLHTDRVPPACFLGRGQACLLPRTRTSPPATSLPCRRSPSCFLVRGSGLLVSLAGDKPPSATSHRADEVPCLFPLARIRPRLLPRARTSPLR